MSKLRDSVRLPEKSGTRKGPLNVPEELKDPAYNYRWFNDTGYRLSSALDMGYNFIPVSELDKLSNGISERGIRDASAKDGTHICRVVGPEVKSYLMRISKELAEERQLEKAKIVNEIEESLTNKSNNGTYTSVEFNKQN